MSTMIDLFSGCGGVTAGFKVAWFNVLAAVECDCAITPREAARLQTFPDSYRFYGSYEQISAQIGNAVPVKLVEVFANYFFTLLERQRNRAG